MRFIVWVLSLFVAMMAGSQITRDVCRETNPQFEMTVDQLFHGLSRKK